MDESRKLIAPLYPTSGEKISRSDGKVVGRRRIYDRANSARRRNTKWKPAWPVAAKGGELLSGDSYSTLELGNGKFAVAISDGMGNGERANAGKPNGANDPAAAAAVRHG